MQSYFSQNMSCITFTPQEEKTKLFKTMDIPMFIEIPTVVISKEDFDGEASARWSDALSSSDRDSPPSPFQRKNSIGKRNGKIPPRMNLRLARPASSNTLPRIPVRLPRVTSKSSSVEAPRRPRRRASRPMQRPTSEMVMAVAA